MGEHLASVDLEALAELDVGPVDELLQVRLALDQRQLPQIVTVEVKQVERDQHDLGRLALQLVLQDREVGGAVRGRHDDLAIDDRGTGADVPGIVGDLLEAFGPVVAAPGEDLDGLVGEVDLDPIAVELDLVKPAVRRIGTFSIDVASAGSMKPGNGRLDADRRRFFPHAQTSRCRVVGA